MARRRTYADAVRTKIVSLRLTEADYLRLKLDSSWAGLSVSGLAQKLVREGRVEVIQSDIPAPLSPALMGELKRVGNNLNQIAHAVNSNLPPDVQFMSKNLSRLIDLLAQDELLNERLKAAAKRMPSNDSTPPQARSEFQRIVHLHPARSGEE